MFSSRATSLYGRFEWRTTAISVLPSRVAAPTRQRPAFVVHPVLTPIACAYNSSRRFLFTYTFEYVGAGQLTRLIRARTISRKRASRNATRVSAARSEAVE